MGHKGDYYGRGRYKDDGYDSDRTSASCFPASVRVLTPLGERAIGELEVGDQVISFNLRQGSLASRRITRKLVYGPAHVIRIGLASGREPLLTTGSHTVLTGRGWVKVKSLVVGDSIIAHNNDPDASAIVSDIEVTSKVEHVYNIYTECDHTFIAEGLVVHNFTTLRTLRTFFHTYFLDKLFSIRAKGNGCRCGCRAGIC